jgi:ribose 5-phosphate isomerase B
MSEQHNKRLVLGSDHAGWALKQTLREWLERECGWETVDVGCAGEQSCDYPDYAAAAARRVASGEFPLGVLACGTGLGVSLAANKIGGVRAVPCAFEIAAELARRHNNANVLCLGSRLTGEELAKAIVRRFLATDFEGGRHERRVQKIAELEAEWRNRTT